MIPPRVRASRKSQRSRKQRIDAAIEEAKRRAGYRCLITGLTREQLMERGSSILVGAHLLPRNVGFPRYTPDNPDNIIPMSQGHHYLMDANFSPRRKADWLRAHNLPYYADRILWIIGEIEEEPVNPYALAEKKSGAQLWSFVRDNFLGER